MFYNDTGVVYVSHSCAVLFLLFNKIGERERIKPKLTYRVYNKGIYNWMNRRIKCAVREILINRHWNDVEERFFCVFLYGLMNGREKTRWYNAFQMIKQYNSFYQPTTHHILNIYYESKQAKWEGCVTVYRIFLRYIWTLWDIGMP